MRGAQGKFRANATRKFHARRLTQIQSIAGSVARSKRTEHLMFFLLKSAFWLALVFYCMSWPGGERPDMLARQAAGDLVQRAQTAAVDSAAAACRSDPARCLAIASAPAHAALAAGRPQLRGTISD